MIGMLKSKANSKSPHNRAGFSIVEMLVVGALLTIVTGFGLLGISQAKASVRLSGAARQYASYIEKTRVFSIRSHADDASERAGVAINENRTSYNVTLDVDGDGDLDTQTIPLPQGVTFETIETIAFDWRGRTWNTVGGVTTPNAQVSIRLHNSNGSISIDVTGSGDVTIDSRVFDDAVPNVSLKIGDLALGATPTPTPLAVVASPDASPVAVASPVSVDPTTQPTPDLGGGSPVGIATPAPSPTATATATPTPSPVASATPTPTPQVCSLTADKVLATIGLDGTTTIKVQHDSSSSLTITATSSKPSEIQVSPSSLSVAAGSAGSFTIKSKKSIGAYSVIFSTGCGSKTIPITVL